MCMKNIVLYLLISLLAIPIVFFILSFNHLSKLTKEEEKYQEAYVDYDEKLKKEKDNKIKLNDEINKLNDELTKEKDLNQNLKSINEINKKQKQELEKRVK